MGILKKVRLGICLVEKTIKTSILKFCQLGTTRGKMGFHFQLQALLDWSAKKTGKKEEYLR